MSARAHGAGLLTFLILVFASCSTPSPRVYAVKEPVPAEESNGDQRRFLSQFIGDHLSGSWSPDRFDACADRLVTEATRTGLDSESLRKVLGALRASGRGGLPDGAFSTTFKGQPAWIISTHFDGHYHVFAFAQPDLQVVGETACK